MKLEILTEKEYLNYALKHNQISIYQLPEWGLLKSKNGWQYYMVGFKKNKKIIAASLLLSKSTPIKRSIFYAPRGFLIDYNDKKLLNNFVNEVKIFIKNKKGFMLKIDPYVIYQLRDNNGKEINDKNDSLVDNIVDNDFKHLGFTTDIDGMQPRFLCRFKLKENYDKTINTFGKSTKKNILSSYDKGVVVREAEVEDIGLFTSLLDKTAGRKKFAIRPTYYYKNMFTLLKDYTKIYIASIDTNKYLNIILDKIENEKKLHKEIVKKMETENVGKKLKTELEHSNRRSLRLIEERKVAEKLVKESKLIDIATLYAIYIGNEGITFMSGINNEYRNFNPKYAMYDTHIRECLKQKKEYVNFYGISGNFDPKSPLYGIYELKKGFNTEVVELIGEFDLILNKPTYLLYKSSFFIYSNLKRIRSSLSKD